MKTLINALRVYLINIRIKYRKYKISMVNKKISKLDKKLNKEKKYRELLLEDSIKYCYDSLKFLRNRS